MISKEIDLARVGLSKSLMTTPCERKAWYGETVRDAEGRRLRLPMPERVIFGSAIDSMHMHVVAAVRERRAPDLVRIAEAVLLAARAAECSEEIEWEAFDNELRTATIELIKSPDGLRRIPLDGIRIQGNEGESLRWDDLVGTPDYLLGDGSVLDVKAPGKSYSPSRFYTSIEMPIYAYLASRENGVIPPRMIYQTWVRTKSPQWKWLEAPASSDMIELGRVRAHHWRRLLEVRDPDLFSTDTVFCKDCGYREPMPEYGHEGCPVGLLVPVGGNDVDG